MPPMRWSFVVLAGCGSFSGPGLSATDDGSVIGLDVPITHDDGSTTTPDVTMPIPDAVVGLDSTIQTMDTDGDGIPDSQDNCPTVANANQLNEDHDAFGDVCDPCPPFPETTPVTDTDHDGVSDKCDPRPNTPGDKILVFEGFANGKPTTWGGFGNWSGAAGQLVGDGTGSWGPSFDANGGETVTAQVGLDQDNTFAGVALASSDLKTYVECDLFHSSGIGGGGSGTTIFDNKNANGNSSFAFSLSTPFTIQLTRTGGTYTCGSLQNAGQNVLNETLIPVYAGAEVVNGKGHFDWFMVVSHP